MQRRSPYYMGFELNIRTPIKMQEYNERIDLDEIHVNFAIPGIYYIIDKEDKTLESIFINFESLKIRSLRTKYWQ